MVWADRPLIESGIMDPLAWVREQGVVLQSARGPVPNLAEQIAGEPIRGSWWATHPAMRSSPFSTTFARPGMSLQLA
jgi:hypothetical protein